MSGPRECPSCHVSMKGDPIPEEIRGYYQESHWTRAVAVIDRDKDRQVLWECPDCQHRWRPEARPEERR